MSDEVTGAERFVLEPQWDRPEYGPDYDGLCVVDTTTNTVVGCDGGEPEDQTLGRDWRWVVSALNAVDVERDAAIAERDEWKRRAEYAERELSDAFGLPVAIGPADGEAKRIVDKGRAAIAERDRLRAEVDVLRGVGCCEDRGAHEPPSGPCGVCIRCARAERDRLRRELEALRDDLDRHARESEGDLFDDLMTRVLARYARRINAILSGGGR